MANKKLQTPILNKNKRLRIIFFFVNIRSWTLLGRRKAIHSLGNRTVDYWFFTKTFKKEELEELNLKRYIRRRMRFFIGQDEKKVDYVGTFTDDRRHTAIFLVLYKNKHKPREYIITKKLSSVFLKFQHNWHRLFFNVIQLASVRYPYLYKKFVQIRLKSEREILTNVREKFDPSKPPEDPKEKRRRFLRRRFEREKRSGDNNPRFRKNAV